MQTYPYAWLPVVVVVGTAVVLTNAYLALIVLMFIVPALLVALAAAIVYVPFLLGRYVVRKWQEHGAARTHEVWSVERQRGSAG